MKLLSIPRKRLYGSVQLSLSGIIEYADIDYSRILGRALEDLIGRYIADLVDESDRDAAKARHKALVSTGKHVQACKRYLSSDLTTTIPVLTNGCILRNAEGSPIGIIAFEQKLSDFGLTRMRTT